LIGKRKSIQARNATISLPLQRRDVRRRKFI
jgi:hypothetical protein